ncbi:uncharacterized protein LOC134846775 [Symsagittifera roscoffensis]|uniref:uncharacterized protein LOC134846775 n=1 Tax=Symsagittifera roscoffensis TaxID=84072 RepID=UPI00307B191B
MCYVDDLVIATPTLADHIDRLDEVFHCMNRAGLKCKPSKFENLRDSIKHLGRMVDKHGVKPDPDAVEDVMEGPQNGPTAHEFPGIAHFYHEFINRNADKVYPMQQLMCNKR